MNEVILQNQMAIMEALMLLMDISAGPGERVVMRELYRKLQRRCTVTEEIAKQPGR